MVVIDVQGTDDLYRKLQPEHVKNSEITWLAYRHPNNDPQISVDLAKLTTPEECLARDLRPGRGIGAAVAQVPRDLNCEVFHDPIADNHAHTTILTADKTRVLLAELARNTRVLSAS